MSIDDSRGSPNQPEFPCATVDDFPERTALARAGASMDLDQLVDYLLDEFDRIATTTPPTDEQTPKSG